MHALGGIRAHTDGAQRRDSTIYEVKVDLSNLKDLAPISMATSPFIENNSVPYQLDLNIEITNIPVST